MPPDLEQATERTKLLSHIANDRRASLVQQEDEAASVIASHVSKSEQLLSTATVGERLPYNDYTTIDWLHDLVGDPTYSTKFQLTGYRSKTPTVTVLSILNTAFASVSFLYSSPAQDGSPLLSLVFSRHA